MDHKGYGDSQLETRHFAAEPEACYTTNNTILAQYFSENAVVVDKILVQALFHDVDQHYPSTQRINTCCIAGNFGRNCM